MELTPVPPQFCNDTRMKILITDGETGLPLGGAAISVVFDEPSETCDCGEGRNSFN